MSHESIARDPRLITKEWSLRVNTDVSNDAVELVDLSIGGVKVRTLQALTQGETLTLFNETVGIRCKVAWTGEPADDKASGLYGLEFLENSQNSIKFLRSLLTKLEKDKLVEACASIFAEGEVTTNSLQSFVGLFRNISSVLHAGLKVDEGVRQTLESLASDLDCVAVSFFVNSESEKISEHISSFHIINEQDISCGRHIQKHLNDFADELSKAWRGDPDFRILRVPLINDDAQALAFPIIADGDTFGFAVFITNHEPKDPRSTGILLKNAGIELGQFIKQKIFEEQMKKLESELVRSSKLQTVSKLAGGVAHQINNPLTVVLGYVSKMEGLIRKKNFDESQMGEACERIRSSARRIADNVRYLMAFSQNTSTAAELSPFPVTELLEEVRDLSASLEKHYSAAIGIESASEESWILINPRQLSQSLFHLMEYLLEKSEGERGVRVYTKRTSSHLSFHVELLNGSYNSPTTDDVFSPFSGFPENSTCRASGLSLPVAKIIVESHEGELSYYNDPTKPGFELTLPVQKIKSKVA